MNYPTCLSEYIIWKYP